MITFLWYALTSEEKHYSCFFGIFQRKMRYNTYARTKSCRKEDMLQWKKENTKPNAAQSVISILRGLTVMLRIAYITTVAQSATQVKYLSVPAMQNARQTQYAQPLSRRNIK